MHSLARLDLQQARLVLDALPPEVVTHVGRCPIHTGAAGEAFGLAEFLRRVAGHLQVGPDAVGAMVSAVFRALRAQLPPHPNET